MAGHGTNVTYFCLYLPPNVNSKGMFVDDRRYGSWMNFSLPRFEVVAVFILFVSQACHFLLQRFGLPMFLSQLIAGRLLVATILDKDKVNIEDDMKVLGTIATIGYAACIFQIGVKVDFRMIGRAGKKAVCLGFFSVFASTLCGLAAARLLIENNKEFSDSFFFIVLTTSSTSFPVITSLLNDLKIVNSELGRIRQSAALVSDILSMILMICIITLRLGMGVKSFQYLGMIFGLLFVVVFIVRPAMNWIAKNTPRNGRVKNLYIYIIICLFLLSTYIPRWFPHFIVGPYIIGLAIPTGPPLGPVIAEKFDGLTSGFFMPLFVAACAIRKDFDMVDTLHGEQIAKNAIIIGLTFLVKFGASFSTLTFARFPKRDGCALALIMCTKGFVELGNIGFLSDSQLVSSKLLCLMSIAITIIGSLMPVLVKFLYDPSKQYTAYERRTIMHLSPNSNLQIFTSIHVPNHVSAVTNLLEASGASVERPIGLHVLHMIKLSGQAAPVFISHDNRKTKFADDCSCSENVILSFTRFEANNWGSVSVNVFTSISTPDLMYEDVCTLALDRSASLILLPFHRRWYLDRSVESDDNSLRVLNKMILDRAPCSVGILVDRGCKRRLTSIESTGQVTHENVAMIFLGGNDDREALVYAMRMAEDPNISLAVARLFSADDTDNISWSKVLDTEALKDIKSHRHIRYIEHEVENGPDTIRIIRLMMKEFDFFIIGRTEKIECQQTAGLDEWMEYPELGVIGVMFVASDVLEEKFSALVIQQQHLTTS